MTSFELLKGQDELLQHEVEVCIKENRIATAIYTATTRSIGYVHTHDHTGEVKRIPSTNPARDLELLNGEVGVPGGVTALIRAAQFGDMENLEKLIHLNVEIEYETIGGSTAFSEACKMGYREVCVRLIQEGADPNRENRFRETPLVIACRTPGGNDFVRWLLESTKTQVTPAAMLEAGCQAEHQSLFCMLDHGGDVDVVGPTGLTLLTQACENGKGGTAIVCVDRGATLDLETPTGHTALTQASFFGHVAIVRMLLGKGAKVDYETKQGYTALNQCCVSGTAAVARILLDKGADPNRNNQFGHMPLTLAARHGQTEVVGVLLARGAKVNQESRTGGRIALVEACRFNHPNVVKRLVAFPDTSVNVETRSEMSMHLTPLVAAAYYNSLDVVTPLMKTLTWTQRNGVELYRETCELIGPIDACILKSNAEMMKILLGHMSKRCESPTLLKERNSRGLLCKALEDYIEKAEEFSGKINKMQNKLKEKAEIMCDILRETLKAEQKNVALLRKKHFEKLRIEELMDVWNSMGPGDRKGKRGNSVLAELDGLDSELVVKLKFEHLGIEPSNN
jgi:ankyrin repeat protein